MYTMEGTVKRIVVIRLEAGEDLLEGIRKGVQEQNIVHGSILSIVGSITSYHLHTVKTIQLPPGRITYSEQGLAYDIIGGTGAILNGRVHIHLTICNHNRVLGGHLHEGTEVHCFGIITVAELANIDLTDIDRFPEQVLPPS
jgi:predicted DNA-binding protein with PD1-like motif